MNNDELKKKIEGILQEEIEYVVVCGSSEKNVCIEHIADALIAAGFGDVRALEISDASKEQSSINYYCEMREWKDKCREAEHIAATAAEIVAQAAASTAIKKIAEWKHRVEVYKRALHIAHTAGEFAYYVDKAEKELTEERK